MAITVIPSVVRCSECFATVQFESSDVRTMDYYGDYYDDHVYFHYITCPCCGAIIRLD